MISTSKLDLTWSGADIMAAHRQGWFFFLSCDFHASTIDDNVYTPRFTANAEARAFVQANAAKGDVLCQRAVAIATLRRLTA